MASGPPLRYRDPQTGRFITAREARRRGFVIGEPLTGSAPLLAPPPVSPPQPSAPPGPDPAQALLDTGSSAHFVSGPQAPPLVSLGQLVEAGVTLQVGPGGAVTLHADPSVRAARAWVRLAQVYLRAQVRIERASAVVLWARDSRLRWAGGECGRALHTRLHLGRFDLERLARLVRLLLEVLRAVVSALRQIALFRVEGTALAVVSTAAWAYWPSEAQVEEEAAQTARQLEDQSSGATEQ